MTDDVDMSAFLAPEQKEPVVVTGKAPKKKKNRAKPYDGKGDTELQDMRKQAKSLCNSYEQYRSVSRYKKERLRDWLEQKQFDSDAALHETVFSFAHQAYAFAVDFMTKGGGHVKDRLTNDLTLRTAIEDEGRDMVKYLTNKSKIAFLTVSDTWEGKLEQRSVEKQNEPIQIEEIQEYNGTTGTTEANTNNDETGGDDEFMGEQQQETDTTDYQQVLHMHSGTEEMQETTETVPGDTSGKESYNSHSWETRIRENLSNGEQVVDEPESLEGGL